MIFLLLGALAGVLTAATASSWRAGLVAFVAAAILTYVALPVLAFGFWGLPLIVLAALAAGVFVYSAPVANRPFRKRGTYVRSGIVVALAVVVGIVAFLTSSPVLHHAALRGLSGDVSESTFSADTAPIDPMQVRQVDSDYAARIGEKRLGENTALGSQVRVGTWHIQSIHGRLYWAAPLEHTSCVKWWTNRAGTPGYLLVSATDERDVRLVDQTADGQPIRLRYNGGACLGDEPVRYLYTHGYAATPLTDFTFEVDDDMAPHLVATRYARRVGFGGEQATGVVVLDLETGAVADYDIDDAPAWIDRIQPEEITREHLDDWGRYVHGWWNPSDRDEMQTTPGTSLVYGSDGRAYWYTGLTSVGADESTVGFAMVDTRTGRTKFYKQTGATETAAMSSAEGSVQEKGYTATFPVTYNVAGAPTYFVSLKDQEGLVKARAFVSVQDYQVVGLGDDVRSALQAYRRSLISRGNAIAPEAAVAWEHAEGRVLRFTAEPRGERVYYYLLIEGLADRAFVGTSDLTMELPLTREGDEVEVRYEDGGGETVDLTGFDNLTLDLRRRPAQRAVEHAADLVIKDRVTERTAPDSAGVTE